MKEASWVGCDQREPDTPYIGPGMTYLSNVLLFCQSRNRASIADVLNFSEARNSEKFNFSQGLGRGGIGWRWFPKVQTSGYNYTTRDIMHSMINIINPAVCYIWKLLKEQILRVAITRKNMFSLILYLSELMSIHWTSCGHRSMTYVSQVMMRHTLNLYSAVCQLYLNKAGRKNKF